MKRDEVMAMTDEELRIRAAELDGFEFVGRTGWDNPGSSEWMSHPWVRDNTGFRNVPDYPNDIAAAWGLVERLQEMWLYPEVQNVGLHGYLWNVWLDFPGETDSALVAQDENVKRAITKAFILAMEAND